MKILALVVLSILLPLFAHAQSWEDYYSVERISIPKKIDPQVGGLLVRKNGTVAAVFHSGEVMIYDPSTNQWQEYASGLHEPLGIVEDDDGSLVVAQYPELTRLIDEDKDGVADFYQTVTDDFGMTGNYHEFVFGPAKDKHGNYYISLNVASNFAGVFQEIRGDFTPIGMPLEEMRAWRELEWPNIKKRAGRMYSKVPYRGWVLKVTPNGAVIPYASGFRSPDGIGFDKKGRLWVTDNQGDWRGTSPLYHVEQGNFYGHPASLVWKNGWKKDPLKMPVEELDTLRTPAAALFPQGELANSPTQVIPVADSKKFGLPKNELLIGDMNQANLIRYLPERVGGVMQGALIPFYQSKALNIGNHRFSFDDNGTLWIGKTHLNWAGHEGIAKLKWNKNKMLLADQVKLKSKGFKLHFNQAIDISSLDLSIEKHRYHYSASYGSPKVDLSEVKINSLKQSWFKRSLNIELDEIEEGYLYTIKLKGLKNKKGERLMGDVIRYNVVKKK